jgi:methyl-accepting chemotaxis protein
VNETTGTMRELSQTARQAADAAQGVIGLASKSEEFSVEGLDAVCLSTDHMTQVCEEVRGLSGRIGALSQRMQDVFEIASAVGELAERSNLLALNASLEAAKAGAHGKGFAVVAAEMRNLAESSKKAALQVKAIANEVQKAMLATVAGAEQGSRKAEAGAQITAKAGETIRRLADAIRESSMAAKDIAVITGQQNEGFDQVLTAMTDINRTTQESVLITRRSETAARLLGDLAARLQSSVTA